MSGTIPEELGTITVCAGPPTCPLKGDDVIAWQQAGCPRCRRIIVHADGTETEYQAKEVAKLVAVTSWREFLDVTLKSVGVRWTCAGCQQTFGSNAKAFRTTMTGETEYYCHTCCNENG